MKIELQLFFLEYYISCSKCGENFNFSSRPEFPRFCFKSIRTDEEQEKTHYHDGSLLTLLLLNTMFFSFLSTLNGCCDASEINILVNILKNQLFLSLTICALFYISPPPSCHRWSEQSIVPNLLSVEQKRSPIQPSKSPHFPHHKGRNLLQSPRIPPHQPGVPPLGEADDSA